MTAKSFPVPSWTRTIVLYARKLFDHDKRAFTVTGAMGGNIVCAALAFPENSTDV